MPDEQLDYWADVFIARGLRKYLTFEAFIRAPALFMYQFDSSNLRPLLEKQLEVRARLDGAIKFPTRDRRKTKRATVLRDQSLIEPLKHHAWRH